ncbi:MAG: response regulator [Blautia sp.]|uniref:response regulator n=1 Tax=Blautia sp. TaxID=1955243 RepID=UPI002E79103D|nr:response regulator [Blautia sp.]MED9882438.1 response regulator [Blautia sp.]
MLKIVLVDDEKIVLKGISAAIQRESGYELAGIAENGIDGLECIRQTSPDIVMTDIRMPGMTGLEMIRASKKMFPDTVYIVFSGFNEFKYVKEAIGLGVIDYIEKPVTLPKLKDVLKKAGELYRYKENYTSMTQDLEKADRAYIEKCLRDLYERPQEEEKLLKMILQRNPKLRQSYSVCAVKISGNHTQSVDDFRSMVQRLTFDMIRGETVEVYTFYEKDDLILTYFNLGKMEFPFISRLSEQKQKLAQEDLPAAAGISQVHKDFYELKNVFEEADSSHRYAQYLEAEELVRFNEVEYASDIPSEIRNDHKSLEFNYRIGDYDACRKQVRKYLEYLKTINLIPELLNQKCLELIFHLRHLLTDSGIENIMGEQTEYAKIQELISEEQILTWTMKHIDNLLDQAEKSYDTGTSKAVRTVKQYVEKHFSEGISLDEIAEQVHMSPTYLSMLFKKEEGITYIRYLTRVRMEKAMEYLKQGHKAKDVCEMVGYHDYKYFSSQFKSSTGMTLDNFKKSL